MILIQLARRMEAQTGGPGEAGPGERRLFMRLRQLTGVRGGVLVR